MTGVLTFTVCATPASAADHSGSGGNGGGSAISSSAVRSAKAEIGKYEGQVSATGTRPSFDASSAKGKSVWYIPQLLANPFLAQVAGGFKQAMAKAGVHVTVCNGNGSYPTIASCFGQAVSGGAAGIEADEPLDPVLSSVKAATSKGIPVNMGGAQDPSLPLPGTVTAQAAQPFFLEGKLSADWVVQNAGTKGATPDVLFVYAPDITGTMQERQAFQQRLKHLCHGCEETSVGVNLPDWSTQLGSTISSQLTLHPNIRYIVPAADPMIEDMASAITQAGKASSMKVVAINGSLTAMQRLAHGNLTNVVLGIDPSGLGWVYADQMLRLLTKHPALKKDAGPIRVFTQKTTKGISLTARAALNGSWYKNPRTWQQDWLHLWSIGQGS